MLTSRYLCMTMLLALTLTVAGCKPRKKRRNKKPISSQQPGPQTDAVAARKEKIRAALAKPAAQKKLKELEDSLISAAKSATPPRSDAEVKQQVALFRSMTENVVVETLAKNEDGKLPSQEERAQGKEALRQQMTSSLPQNGTLPPTFFDAFIDTTFDLMEIVAADIT